MASGYDISASTSSNTANNSSAGPATSGGVSVGDVSVGGSRGSGLFTPPAKGVNWTPIVLGAGVLVAAGVIWYFVKKKA